MSSLPLIDEMLRIRSAVQKTFTETLSKAGVDTVMSDKIIKILNKDGMTDLMSVTKVSLQSAATALKDVKPRGKDAPRPAQTAYNLFGHDLRERKLVWKDFDAKHANAKAANTLLKKITTDAAYQVAFTDVAELWKVVTNDTRAKYNAQSEADKGRYEKEMEEYVPVPDVPKAPPKTASEMWIREQRLTHPDTPHKDLLAQWNALSDEERVKHLAVFGSKCIEHKQRMELFEQSLSEPQRELLKRKMDPNVPSKPRSAYLFFSVDSRNGVIAEMEAKGEDTSLPAVSTRVAEKWTALTDAGKAPYVKKAEDDKERFKKEMEMHARGEYVSPKVVEAREREYRAKANQMFLKHQKSVWKGDASHASKSGKELHTEALEAWKLATEEDKAKWLRIAKGEEDAPESSSPSSSSDSSASSASKKSNEAEAEVAPSAKKSKKNSESKADTKAVDEKSEAAMKALKVAEQIKASSAASSSKVGAAKPGKLSKTK